MSERAAIPFGVRRPGWIDEFKAFIMRGNVIDLAVGIIIGVAFTAVIQFLIVSFAVFWLIKALTRMHVRQEPAAAAPPRSEVLLEAIRDLLAARSAPRP